MWFGNRIVDAKSYVTRSWARPGMVLGVCGVGVLCGQVLGLLVPVSSNPLPGFHIRPIKPVVYLEALPQQSGWEISS